MKKQPFDAFERGDLSIPTDVEGPLSIWERRDVYLITKYSYRENLVYLESEGVGSVSLWGRETRFGTPPSEDETGGHYIAGITFKKPGVPLEPFRYAPEYGHENYMLVDLEVGQRDAIIDLLRNEGPVYVLVFHRGRPEREITWAWIGTASCQPEEVGEGED